MPLTKIVTGVITDGTITSDDMAVDPRNASNLNAGDVPLAQLDNVQTVDLNPINSDIAILAFKTQANGNLARYNLVDQSVDSFEDASGVNASASTNENRDSAGKYYYGGTPTTPTAAGGTITTYGDYTIHTFLTGANYTNDTAQSTDILIVAGGGGGGGHDGAGGGAGGVRVLAAQSIGTSGATVVVGGGGSGTATQGGQASDGTNSSVAIGGGATLTATGGGGGGSSGASSCGGAGGSGIVYIRYKFQ